MKRILTTTMIAGIAGTVAFAAIAQETPRFGGSDEDRQARMEERKVRMEERFNMADLNGDGKISQEEIDAKKAERFAEIDADGNGLITQVEAEAYHEAKREERRKRNAERRFNRADANGDGGISIEEFDDRMGRGMEFADANEDGFIELAELEALGKKHGKRKHHHRRD